MNFHKIKESLHKNKKKEGRLNDDDGAFSSKRPFWAVALSVFSLERAHLTFANVKRCIKRSVDAHISWQLHNFEFFCCGV